MADSRSNSQNQRKRKKTNNVKQYTKPLNINLGVLIFIVIFLYVCICVVVYLGKEQIQPYVVKEGSLATSNYYTSIVMREETVVNSTASGYINFFKKEGDRTAVGDHVFAIDETNYIAELLETQKATGNSLSDNQLSDLKNEIENFNEIINPKDFQLVYQFKSGLDNELLKIANASVIDLLNSDSSNTSDFLDFNSASESGIIMYWCDGLEGLSDIDVTMKLWDNDEYEKHAILNGDLLTPEDVAYKVCTNENWSICFPIEQALGEEYLAKDYIKVRFLKNKAELWGKVSLFHDIENQYYIKLTFTNSMNLFITDRFLEIEVIVDDEVGLKIPNESMVEKDFYLIPEEYIIFNGSKAQVLKETVLENGSISTILTSVFIHNKIDENGTITYYVDDLNLRAGDRLHGLNSTNQFVVSKTASLIGVYNMNKGFADFKTVSILYQNEQYSIVQSNTSYGLNAYDYIVLDATTVSDGDFIYD